MRRRLPACGCRCWWLAAAPPHRTRSPRCCPAYAPSGPAMCLVLHPSPQCPHHHEAGGPKESVPSGPRAWLLAWCARMRPWALGHSLAAAPGRPVDYNQVSSLVGENGERRTSGATKCKDAHCVHTCQHNSQKKGGARTRFSFTSAPSMPARAACAAFLQNSARPKRPVAAAAAAAAVSGDLCNDATALAAPCVAACQALQHSQRLKHWSHRIGGAFQASSLHFPALQ
eukprot:354628-Pelagomonas_calceolata.AAC.2